MNSRREPPIAAGARLPSGERHVGQGSGAAAAAGAKNMYGRNFMGIARSTVVIDAAGRIAKASTARAGAHKTVCAVDPKTRPGP